MTRLSRFKKKRNTGHLRNRLINSKNKWKKKNLRMISMQCFMNKNKWPRINQEEMIDKYKQKLLSASSLICYIYQ